MIKPAYLDKPSAAAFVALSERAWERMVQMDQAPKPRQLSSRRVGWLVRELEEWAEARPVSDLLPPPNTGRKGVKPCM